MSQTVADFMIERLSEWGVERIYGYPGDGINGIMGALQRAEGTGREIEFVQSHQGVVAIVGQQDRRALGGDYQQEVDLLSLFKDVANRYVQDGPGHARARRPRLPSRCGRIRAGDPRRSR